MNDYPKILQRKKLPRYVDQFCDIAEKIRNEKRVLTDWIDFGHQKNQALKYESGDWILSLDADEWITPELKAEILVIIQNPGSYVAFEMLRLSSYYGQYIRHSGW